MESLLINANYYDDVKLTDEALAYLKPFKRIGLYAAIQFAERLSTVLEQLKEHEVVSCQPERTHVQYQILGCDCYKSNFDHSLPDVFLYIGDGLFHPRALVIMQKDQKTYIDVACFDPIAQSLRVLDAEHGVPIFRKYKAGLMKFMNAQHIGLFVTVKWGQQQFRISQKLEKVYPEKSVYTFIGNTLERNTLEDFPFIDQWVNTACPRIGFDDNIDSTVTMINITDALQAKDILSKDSLLTRA